MTQYPIRRQQATKKAHKPWLFLGLMVLCGLAAIGCRGPGEEAEASEFKLEERGQATAQNDALERELTAQPKPTATPLPPLGHYRWIAGPHPQAELPIPSAPGYAPQPIRDPLSVWSNDDHIIVVLRPGDLFLESQDAGLTWSTRRPNFPISHVTPGADFWWALADLDELGRAHRVARSEDGGETWELRNTNRALDPLPSALYSIDKTLYVVSGSYLLASKDQRKWLWVNPKVDGNIEVLEKIGEQLCVATQEGEIACQKGDGEWQLETLPEAASVRDLAIRADGTRFAATDKGLYQQQASQWIWLESIGHRPLSSIAFDESDRAYLVGEASFLASQASAAAEWTLRSAELTGIADPFALNWRQVLVLRDQVFLFGDGLSIVELVTN